MGEVILGVMLIITFTWLCYVTWRLCRLVNEFMEQYETLCRLSAAEKIGHNQLMHMECRLRNIESEVYKEQ